jgi:alkylhydroperoxidase family enzyme
MARVPLINGEDLPESYDIVYERDQKLATEIDSDFWNRQPTVQAFSNNSELGKTHVTTNTTMWTETGLTEAETECVIMLIARELECGLLWNDHVELAMELDRLSEEEILWISDRDFENFDEKRRHLVEYTLEYVTEQGAISDVTHEALASHYDNETIVGIAMLAGFYISLSHEVKALQLVRDDFYGWRLENYHPAE